MTTSSPLLTGGGPSEGQPSMLFAVDSHVNRSRPPASVEAWTTLDGFGHDREQQVLAGMAQGLTNPEIGAQLFLGEQTIKTYVRRLFATLGARNRHHAVSLGYLYGLLPDVAFPVRVSQRPRRTA